MPYMSSWQKEHNRQMLHIHHIKTQRTSVVLIFAVGCHTKKENNNNNKVEIQQKREWDKTEIMKLEINKITIL